MAFDFANPAAVLFPARAGEQGAARAEVERAEVEGEVLRMFDALRGGLLRYGVSMGIPLADAEDVLQEAFLALFRHLMEGRSRSNLEGWMFRVTHNLALKRRAWNQSRAQVKEVEAGGWEECRDGAPSPEAEVLFRERQERLRAVVAALPETDRWCLQMRAEGLRYREIAKVVGISLGSVASSLARSMARMERTDAR